MAYIYLGYDLCFETDSDIVLENCSNFGLETDNDYDYGPSNDLDSVYKTGYYSNFCFVMRDWVCRQSGIIKSLVFI